MKNPKWSRLFNHLEDSELLNLYSLLKVTEVSCQESDLIMFEIRRAEMDQLTPVVCP